ncbi:uncharacterized protein SPSK_09926 [Sporothrix schenckii 1099-18]|uniref:Uncharacterized protein n=1 Tax=Sporothrix schenckii 1099-18 TaxID=1397361 RepID=A0A0F2M670_SPOSC|nr:uncharacterized protein SPSK_09926 [Sporothrix schenckii 1099-18]KJR84300.1 hypothetical protein SPSK_09926 [Sporothrix schenckii 1099-18]
MNGRRVRQRVKTAPWVWRPSRQNGTIEWPTGRGRKSKILEGMRFAIVKSSRGQSQREVSRSMYLFRQKQSPVVHRGQALYIQPYGVGGEILGPKRMVKALGGSSLGLVGILVIRGMQSMYRSMLKGSIISSVSADNSEQSLLSCLVLEGLTPTIDKKIKTHNQRWSTQHIA